MSVCLSVVLVGMFLVYDGWVATVLVGLFVPVVVVYGALYYSLCPARCLRELVNPYFSFYLSFFFRFLILLRRSSRNVTVAVSVFDIGLSFDLIA